ncbi:hypothetical protein M0802_004392 [Mischocyttarus mexicanus]|nr:hypothetical protein M0802_004392 [Mischocyttarus mexicanus]
MGIWNSVLFFINSPFGLTRITLPVCCTQSNIYQPAGAVTAGTAAVACPFVRSFRLQSSQ